MSLQAFAASPASCDLLQAAERGCPLIYGGLVPKRQCACVGLDAFTRNITASSAAALQSTADVELDGSQDTFSGRLALVSQAARLLLQPVCITLTQHGTACACRAV